VNGVTYDAGALIAAERGEESVWLLHRRLLERELRPTLPTVVLGQVWRGGPQEAGAALAASQGRDLVDAAVVVTALAREDLILSSDPDDLRRIASAIGRDLTVHVV
jgi:hypothetical protein